MALERKPLPLAAVPRRKPQGREPEAQATAAPAPPAAPVAPEPPASEPATPAEEAEQAAAPPPDRSQPIVPSITVDEPSVDEPSASTRPGGSLRLDPAQRKGKDASGDGGPAIWWVAVLLGVAAVALFLNRRRLPRPARWLPREAAARMRPPT